MNIKINVLNVENISQHNEIFEMVVEQLIKISNIELEEELEIVVPEDFTIEVEDFQEQYKLPIGHSPGAAGKTFHYLVNGKKYHKIFINKWVFDRLYYFHSVNNDKDFYCCVNVVHHELMHVYDECKASNIYENILNYEYKPRYKSMISIGVYCIWQEYYACRMASSTIKKDLVDETVIFLNDIDAIQYELEELVYNNKSNDNPDIFHTEVTTLIINFLRKIAYYLGNFYAYSRERDSILEFLKSVCSKTEENLFINTTISNMTIELDALFDNYLKWEPSDFDKLNKIIARVYSNYNILLQHDGNGRVFAALTNFGNIK